jgi:hypothetical protein
MEEAQTGAMGGRKKAANGRSSRLVGTTRGMQHKCEAAELPADPSMLHMQFSARLL